VSEHATREVRDEQRPALDLEMLTAPDSTVAEAYRELRATLKHARHDPPIQTVLLANTGAGDQYAGAVANLGAAIALGGDTVTVVDADLRSPGMHQLLRTPAQPGLSDWLAFEPDAPLPLHATVLDNLRVLPSGLDTGPGGRGIADRIRDAAAIRMFELLRSGARFTIVSCAPLPSSSDALALAPFVDAVLLVIRAGVTKRTHAQRAREALDRVGANVLGAILTDAR
jgi:Mrp family chromosome partitioning ATPase